MATPKPLRSNNHIISWPKLNPQHEIAPVHQLLVDVTAPNGNSETISMKYAYLKFHPLYSRYVHSNYGPETTLYEEIWNYVHSLIETPIHYRYKAGQYGWITTDNELKFAFVQITKRSEYETEFFFLHETLQKYEIKHLDVTSMEPKGFADDEFDGKSTGWIEESMFTAIEGINANENDERDKRLNWKICREDYLLKKIAAVTLDLNERISNRGVLFRDTVKQWMAPKIKALRGKVTNNNIGKVIEIPFFTPRNIWQYYLDPTFKRALDLNENDALETDGDKVEVLFDMMQIQQIIPISKLLKLYDQNGNAFKYVSIEVDVNEFADIDEVNQFIVAERNKIASNRYLILRQDHSNKFVVLRKTGFLLTVNGIKWEYNEKSGKSKFAANVYRITYLSSGRTKVHGLIDFV